MSRTWIPATGIRHFPHAMGHIVQEHPLVSPALFVAGQDAPAAPHAIPPGPLIDFAPFLRQGRGETMFFFWRHWNWDGEQRYTRKKVRNPAIFKQNPKELENITRTNPLKGCVLVHTMYHITPCPCFLPYSHWPWYLQKENCHKPNLFIYDVSQLKKKMVQQAASSPKSGNDSSPSSITSFRLCSLNFLNATKCKHSCHCTMVGQRITYFLSDGKDTCPAHALPHRALLLHKHRHSPKLIGYGRLFW